MLSMAEHWLVLLTFPWLDQAAVQPPLCLLQHTSCCSPYVPPSWNESLKSTTNPSPTVWAKWFFKMITWKDATYTVTSSDRHELKQRGGLLVRAPSTGMYYFSYCNDYTHTRQQMACAFFSPFAFSPFLALRCCLVLTLDPLRISR